MNYIKKMELLSEGFSHQQIEEMERNEVLSEGEELGYAKQLANQTAIFNELKKKYAITVYELTTNRDRTKIKYDATMASSYKEIIFGFRGKKYQYNFRYNKIKQVDGEYDINKSSWEKEQLMPSNFISDDVKLLFKKLAHVLQENSHKDHIYFDKNGKWRTSNPHQADMDKYKEKVEKTKNPEEKEKAKKELYKLAVDAVNKNWANVQKEIKKNDEETKQRIKAMSDKDIQNHEYIKKYKTSK